MTPRLTLRTLGDLQLSAAAGDELLGRRYTDLALLMVLVDRAPAPVRREELQTLFWGERTEEKARHSLRQVIARLRQACGDALQIDPTFLRVAEDGIGCDAIRFASAASAGNCPGAIELWTGEFLPGCESVGAEGFRAWLDVERERLRRLLLHCYERRTVELEARGDWAALGECASGWIDRFPLDERPQLSRIEALCKTGRVADAAAAQASFVRRLSLEMDVAPEDEWLAATDQLIREAREQHASELRDLPLASEPEKAASITATALTAQPPRERRTIYRVASGLAATALIAILGARIATARPGKPPSLAIGEITSSSEDSARDFGRLLTIDLARIPDLDVISDRRLSEIAAGRPGEKLDVVARAAGAREVLEGMLTRLPNRALRVDLRRVDLSSGKTRAAYSLEGTDFPQLADLISEEVARDLGVQRPVARREAATNSIVAYRMYEQGLRAFYESKIDAALHFFTAALAEDSTFAMAAFYKGLSIGHDSGNIYLGRALRHAQRTSERERLLITVNWGWRMADPRTLAWADTLVTRYPGEADAQLIYAAEMTSRWNLGEGLDHYRRVFEADSANVRAAVRCRACDAAAGMIHTYMRMDSLAAAERIARIWLRWQPASSPAWSSLSAVLGVGERYPEAHAAIDSAAKYSPDPRTDLDHTTWWFYANDFAPIDRTWRELEKSGKPDVRLDALWTRFIASRTQGRLRDAHAAAREFRNYTRAVRHEPSYTSQALLEAIAMFELGRYRESAAMFDSCARLEPGVPPFTSRISADRAWLWTHAAAGYAAAGDIAALRWVEDSVRVNGLRASDRYHSLHYYVHGLRLVAERRPQEAVEYFRRATPAREDALVRIHLELARALIATGRPGEAIAPLVRALRGPTSAAGLYASRTELQELLGVAYEQSLKPDSAIIQYRRAVDAWRQADPELADRRSRLQARIIALSSAR